GGGVDAAGGGGVDAGASAQVLVGPMDVTVTAPDAATFTAEVTGTPPLAVTWQRSPDLSSWTDVATALLGAPGSTTFTLDPTGVADDGAHVRVVVRGAVDAAGVESAPATLTVLVPTAPPMLTADVHDVAVAEGATATFAATFTGGALGYQWEQSGASGPFGPLPGEVAPTLVLPAVTASMNGRRYRVTATNALGMVTSREARLTVFPTGTLATVYAQHGPPNIVVEHASLATGTDTGVIATADLTAGTFGGRADALGNPGTNRFAYAGLLRALIFVNTTGAPVTIPAGGLRLTVTGAYTHAAAPGGPGTSAHIQAHLGATINDGLASTLTSAAALHQWARSYDQAGNPTSSSYNRFTPHSIQNGGTAVATVATVDALALELVMPALVLPAGATLQLTTTVQSVAQDRASADTLTTPVTLTMTLPAGVHLDRNTLVPLAWVTNLP
ncbi:MAG: hypothetical protein KA297_21760, partial [Kofleriaceae bacterium]|nr:hypothetical protein [Kofleriaceae bacterium]